MKKVAEEGAADRGKAVEVADALNAHRSQTMAIHKMPGALAGAGMVGALFQGRSLRRRNHLCPLMHGTLLCLS
jgi:hypothetical protein